MEDFKSGFVALIGRTNVGKSTLLNLLVGEKVAAIANKVQTTRTAIKGIVNRENSQIVFCMMGGGKFLMDQSGPPSPLYSPSFAPSGASGAGVVSVSTCVDGDCGAVSAHSRWYSGILAKSWA